MARYNRELLVTYLEDICSIYIAMRKIDGLVSERQGSINELNRSRMLIPPKEPEYKGESPIGCGGIFAAFLCLLGLNGFFCMAFLTDSNTYEPVWLFVGAFLILVIYGVITLMRDLADAQDIRESNAEMKEAYLEQVKAYDESVAREKLEKELNRPKVQQLREEINSLYISRNQAVHVLNKLYSANVIPAQYRNMYAVVYLYRWFKTSGSDDLDHALSMFVLEEIKDKLDKIIAQQAESILNQRMMIANQRKSIDNQNRHSRMMQEKIDKLQATEEERLQYAIMTEGNTAATAYFALANYLK